MKNLPGHRLLPAVILLIGTTIGIVGSAAAQSSTVRLVDNHPSAETIATVGATSALASSRNLSMRVVLALRNQPDLTQLLQDLQDPSSSEYHRWLTPQEFTARFGPRPEDIAQVSSWLSQKGFKVTSADPSGRTVWFSGSAAQASSAFKVTFAASPDGRFFGNVESPSIPQSISPLIQSIQGLDNLRARAVTPQPDFR
jgi:subtilase family serine protease